MFCPKCKNEYREGFTVCSECRLPLVMELPHNGIDPLYRLNSKQIFDKFTAYLEYCSIPYETDVQKDDENTFYEVYYKDSKDESRIQTAFQTCIAYEAENELKNTMTHALEENGELSDAERTALSQDVNSKLDMVRQGIMEPDSGMLEDLSKEQAVSELSHAVFQKTKSYESYAHKANEFRSSGIMLIVISILGVIFTFMNMAGVIHIIGVLFSQVVLLSFFVIFFIVGVFSLRSAKNYEAQTESEQVEINAFKNWMKDNISASDIVLPEEEILSEEERILNQQNRLLAIVAEHFPDMDESLMNHFADEYYNENFLNDTEE